MCTATWWRAAGELEVFFNRDERKARSEADPPREFARDGVRWLSPVDPDAGGTWITVNDAGLVVALLNGVRIAGDTEDRWRSRGEIVEALAAHPAPTDVERAIAGRDFAEYRPFRLVALAPDAPAFLAEWNGVALARDVAADARLPLISSSFEENEVGVARRAEYERVTGLPAGRGVLSVEPAEGRDGDGRPRAADSALPSRDSLLAFHRSTEGGPSAYSVSMDRPDAATRSFTRVKVGPLEVEMEYAPGPPHDPGPRTSLRLPRTPLSSRTAPKELP